MHQTSTFPEFGHSRPAQPRTGVCACENNRVAESDTPAFDAAKPETQPTLVFDKQATKHGWPEDILGLLTGTFLAALGIHLLNTAHAVTGGTTGIALLLDYTTNLPLWLLFVVINVPFAFLAITKRGWRFTIRTILSIGLVSGFTRLCDAFLKIDDLNLIFGVLAGNLLVGVALLILFRHNASLGGTSIIALILQDKTGFRAGWTQMILDGLIVLAGLIVVPWQTVLISVVGAVLLSLVLALNHRPGRYIGH